MYEQFRVLTLRHDTLVILGFDLFVILIFFLKALNYMFIFKQYVKMFQYMIHFYKFLHVLTYLLMLISTTFSSLLLIQLSVHILNLYHIITTEEMLLKPQKKVVSARDVLLETFGQVTVSKVKAQLF